MLFCIKMTYVCHFSILTAKPTLEGYPRAILPTNDKRMSFFSFPKKFHYVGVLRSSFVKKWHTYVIFLFSQEIPLCRGTLKLFCQKMTYVCHFSLFTSHPTLKGVHWCLFVLTLYMYLRLRRKTAYLEFSRCQETRIVILTYICNFWQILSN